MKSNQHDECVVCSITMNFSSEEEILRVQDLLLSSIACTNLKMGCLDCRMGVDDSTPEKLLYVEQWENEAAFQRQVASKEFKHVLTAIDLCSEMPDVKVERIYTDSGVECFQTILEGAASLPGSN